MFWKQCVEKRRQLCRPEQRLAVKDKAPQKARIESDRLFLLFIIVTELCSKSCVKWRNRERAGRAAPCPLIRFRSYRACTGLFLLYRLTPSLPQGDKRHGHKGGAPMGDWRAD